MKKNLKQLLTRLIYHSGLPALIRATLQRKTVSILVFHDIEPERAEQVFPWLARRYNIIDLNDYLEARRQNNPGLLPDKALIITLDDGHAGNYRLLEVVRKYHIPVTIFLCSGIVDTRRHYWFKFKRPEFSTRQLKKLPNREKLEVLARAGFWPDREFPEPQALNKKQIEEMSAWVNFQGHTVFHPCLPKCDAEEARMEIFQCKQTLEESFNLKINALAFPNGDYSDRDIELVKRAGYECALTVDHGFNTLQTDPFRLKRLSIDDKDDFRIVALKACGLWSFIKTRNGTNQDHGWTSQVEQGALSKPAAAVLTKFLTLPAWELLDNLLALT